MYGTGVPVGERVRVFVHIGEGYGDTLEGSNGVKVISPCKFLGQGVVQEAHKNGGYVVKMDDGSVLDFRKNNSLGLTTAGV